MLIVGVVSTTVLCEWVTDLSLWHILNDTVLKNDARIIENEVDSHGDFTVI